jgi:multiple sugar transport system substrate-binding protein
MALSIGRTGLSSSVGRRRILRVAGSAAVITAAVGIAPRFLVAHSAHADTGLADGMVGGPTGFAGAERYQYGPDTPEARAIEGIKALVGAGKAPKKLVMMLSEGSVGQLTKPFPAGAPAIRDLFEKEAGIELEIVGVPNGQEYRQTLRDIAGRTGSFDIYATEWNRLGDLAETNGLVKMDEFVEKYRPQWDEPGRGYVGGAKGVALLNDYRGHTYGVSLDGDFQCWIYRKDLFENPKEQAAFKSSYGYDLAFPESWRQLDDVATFFHRPEKGLLGCTDLRNQGWGFTNWYQRFCSTASPNQYLFEDDGTPLINGEHGVLATREYVDSLKYHSPHAISWGWPEQYGNMAMGGAAVTCAFPNMPKLLDNPANESSRVTGKLASAKSPGRAIDGRIVSRSVLWLNLTASISAQTKHAEACYLLLQWLGSSRIYSWMTANPAGYLDPFQLANFRDPLVLESYHGYLIQTIRDVIPRAVPSINYPGATAYHNALSGNLVEALKGSKSAEQAMKDTETAWEAITRKVGRKKIVDAIKASKAAWPTILD